jgi:hypothetical protein
LQAARFEFHQQAQAIFARDITPVTAREGTFEHPKHIQIGRLPGALKFDKRIDRAAKSARVRIPIAVSIAADLGPRFNRSDVRWVVMRLRRREA